MQKLQRNWSEISGELTQHLATCKLDYKQLSEKAGLSYDAARRYLLSKQVKNNNASARALCAFFGVQTSKTANLQIDPLATMTRTLKEVWDGSEPHAELIVGLIRATKSFTAKGRAR